MTAQFIVVTEFSHIVLIGCSVFVMGLDLVSGYRNSASNKKFSLLVQSVSGRSS